MKSLARMTLAALVASSSMMMMGQTAFAENKTCVIFNVTREHGELKKKVIARFHANERIIRKLCREQAERMGAEAFMIK